jgi:hypothetical protein
MSFFLAFSVAFLEPPINLEKLLLDNNVAMSSIEPPKPF